MSVRSSVYRGTAKVRPNPRKVACDRSSNSPLWAFSAGTQTAPEDKFKKLNFVDKHRYRISKVNYTYITQTLPHPTQKGHFLILQAKAVFVVIYPTRVLPQISK